MRRTVLFILLFLASFLASCNGDRSTSQRMFVQSIANGGTLIMVGEGREYRVSLCGVSVAPTQNEEAKKLLQSLLTDENEEDKALVAVPVRASGQSIVAEVYVPTANRDEEKSLNAELLAAGLARATGEACPNREAYQAIEQDAKERRVGLWDDR
ncbi:MULTISPECIES: thermonuclease family protein [Aerosakkonema]|uniref:thermonuclease family protein n=1 Tax=Aerosakkonema TaxID=1246629 RepID=UPI0035B800E0